MAHLMNHISTVEIVLLNLVDVMDLAVRPLTIDPGTGTVVQLYDQVLLNLDSM